MSARQLRRILASQAESQAKKREDHASVEEEGVDEAEEQEEEKPTRRKPQKPMNAFAMLAGDEGEEEEEEEGESKSVTKKNKKKQRKAKKKATKEPDNGSLEDTQGGGSNTAVEKGTETAEGEGESVDTSEAASKKPKGKKKKGKKGKGRAEEKEKKEEDFDEVLKSIAALDARKNKSNPKAVEAALPENLFRLNTKRMDPDAEMRRLFGSKAVADAKVPKKGVARHHAKVNTILVKPKDQWPPIMGGIAMEHVETKNGCNYFRLLYSVSYRDLQEEYYACVQTHDPNSFQELLMINPYHIDSLLQLSQVCLQTGDFTYGEDLLERSIYCFECSWHPMFAPQGLIRCYLKLTPETRSIFLVIFKYIQMLGRRGCPQTSLEYSKLLISLDPDDPFFMRGVIDYYAMRAKEYEYILKLFQKGEIGGCPFSVMPNFCYSAALAAFFIEYDKKSSGSGSNSNDNSSGFDSVQLLQNALMMFPMVLPQLVAKAGISLKEAHNQSLTDPAGHAFFVDCFTTAPLQRVVKLFVDKNFSLWKAPETIQWLKQTVAQVIERVENGDTMVDNLQCAVRDAWTEVENGKSSGGHDLQSMILNEHLDTGGALPPEIMAGGGGGGIPAGLAPRNVPLTTRNLLSLFLRTLMPWNEVPNVPAPEGEHYSAVRTASTSTPTSTSTNSNHSTNNSNT